VLAAASAQAGAGRVGCISERSVQEMLGSDFCSSLAVGATGRRVASVGRRPGRGDFDQVSFRYDPQLPVVHDQVGFTISPGGMTAFVGPSGAGKTTVFSLIQRFYELDTGRVLFDGLDVQRWPLTDLRAAIGYVEQDAPVLSGTLRENLIFGAPEAGADELEQVLRTWPTGSSSWTPAASARPVPTANWSPPTPVRRTCGNPVPGHHCPN
jgi:ABC-type multidrug transport system fused ATPase/permease subunit